MVAMPADVIQTEDYSKASSMTHGDMTAQARHVLRNVEFDTMVGRGLSGAVVIPELARAMRKHWLIIRKPGEATHSADPALGTLGARWIFVDDFISSGATLELTRDGVYRLVDAENENRREGYRWWADTDFPETREPFTTTYVGAYLYRGMGVFRGVGVENTYGM